MFSSRVIIGTALLAIALLGAAVLQFRFHATVAAVLIVFACAGGILFLILRLKSGG